MKFLLIYVFLSFALMGCAKRPADSKGDRAKVSNPKLVPLISRRMRAGHIDFVPHDRIPKLSFHIETKEPFLVPEGTINVALNKPVISSCDNPIIGELNMITDGVMTCRHGDQVVHTDVELESGIQHIAINLNGLYNIYAIRFWHCYPMNPVYFDIIVQIAEDPDFTKNVHILFNNDHDNSIGLGAGTDDNYIEYLSGKLVDGKGIKARYVRLYSNGNWANDFNHYTEVEVYGKPAIE